MSNQEVTKTKTLGERVNFAPNDKDEKKIIWLINKFDYGLSGTIRKAINFYYFAQKSGKYEKFLDEMMDDYE